MSKRGLDTDLPTQCTEWSPPTDDLSSYRCDENHLHPGDHVVRLSTGAEVTRWVNERHGAYAHVRSGIDDPWPGDEPEKEPKEPPGASGMLVNVYVQPDGTVSISVDTRPDVLDSSEGQG